MKLPWSSLLTIGLGAVPASLSALLALLLVLTAGLGIVESASQLEILGVLYGFVFVGWAALALWGTYGLWVAALKPEPLSRAVVAGLAGGIVAMTAAILMSVDGIATNIGAAWLAYCPILVAAWHIRHALLARRGQE